MIEKLTPMMAQYRATKEKYSDCMVLFRLGDFYEMFFEDAVEGSKILGITLTARNKGDGVKAPMCGVPYHAADNYISKLTRAGKKVAICDQMTEPNGHGIVERDVVRVVTPGTTFDDNLLDGKTNNYIACLAQSYDGYGFAYADVTTGDIFVSEFSSVEEVSSEFSRLKPAETIAGKTLIQTVGQISDSAHFEFEIFKEPEKTIIDNFGVKALSVFGLDGHKSAILAGATLYEYIKETQKTDLKHVENIRFYSVSDFMPISESTMKNLDIFHNGRDGVKGASLFQVIDKTLTPMGGRKLKSWMLHPLKDPIKINGRLEAVSELLERSSLLGDLREVLRGIFDIERLLSKLSLGSGNARDLIALKESLKVSPVLKGMLGSSENSFLRKISDDLVDLSDLVRIVSGAIKEEPPFTVREGGMINDGYSAELDELRSINAEGKGFIANMQKREIERSGISSLKIRYNKVFGYYIEISKANLANVPEDYIRKQTLVNAERFITPELKEYEEKVLNSIERICELEYELFYAVRMKVVEKITDIKRVASAIGRLDSICGFAETAFKNRYSKPDIIASDSDESLVIDIRDGRHPILERLDPMRDFVPNDCVIDPKLNVLNLITGPNMGGKSVYLKQVALIVYLAHIGSYVPASSCKLGLVDQIFTRVGASDNLSAGESTFMVEMVEASQILHNATSRSLIILDEIGRGTSTYDGLSIAWAICEYVHDKIRAKTLFATHYHELIGLCEKLPRAKNSSVAVSEKLSNLIFLYKIIDGGTNKSYGIEVAKLAGLPKDLIMRARGVLDKLEAENLDNRVSPVRVCEDQINMFVSASREHKTIDELKGIDPDNLTPMDALRKFHELKEKGII